MAAPRNEFYHRSYLIYKLAIRLKRRGAERIYTAGDTAFACQQ